MREEYIQLAKTIEASGFYVGIDILNNEECVGCRLSQEHKVALIALRCKQGWYVFCTKTATFDSVGFFLSTQNQIDLFCITLLQQIKREEKPTISESSISHLPITMLNFRQWLQMQENQADDIA